MIHRSNSFLIERWRVCLCWHAGLPALPVWSPASCRSWKVCGRTRQLAVALALEIDSHGQLPWSSASRVLSLNSVEIKEIDRVDLIQNDAWQTPIYIQILGASDHSGRWDCFESQRLCNLMHTLHASYVLCIIILEIKVVMQCAY